MWDIVQRWAAGRPDQAGALERLAQHIRWPLMDTAYLQSLDHARCSRSHAYQVPLIAEALHYQRATPAVRKELLDSLGLRATPRQYLLGELVVFDRTGARGAARAVGRLLGAERAMRRGGAADACPPAPD